jgi:hypothetical protein
MCVVKEMMPSAWMPARQGRYTLTLKKELYASIAKNAMGARFVSVPVPMAPSLCIPMTVSYINAIYAGAGLFNSAWKLAPERL